MIVFFGTSLQLNSFMTACSEWLSTTSSIPCWITTVFPSTVTNDKRRILAHTLNWLELRLSVELVLKSKSKSKVMLRLSRSVFLGIKHSYEAYVQIFVTVRDSSGFVHVERSLWREDASVVFESHSQQYVQFIFYMLLNVCIYNIYKASVSPGSVQQIMTYH
jgi:hypothetical protein